MTQKIRSNSRTQAVGRYGENLAARYLQSAGLTLIDRNWRASHGEVDLIALDGSVLVICEVKTRSSEDFGGPRNAVGPAKLKRLRALAAEWLADHQIHVDGVRIDVLAISLPPRGRAVVEHIVGVS